MKIEWPNLPMATLPDDLSVDPFYQCITLKYDNTETTLAFSLISDVCMPHTLLLDLKGATAEDLAESIMERILLDLNIDVLPLLVHRCKEMLGAAEATKQVKQ